MSFDISDRDASFLKKVVCFQNRSVIVAERVSLQDAIAQSFSQSVAIPITLIIFS